MFSSGVPFLGDVSVFDECPFRVFFHRQAGFAFFAVRLVHAPPRALTATLAQFFLSRSGPYRCGPSPEFAGVHIFHHDVFTFFSPYYAFIRVPTNSCPPSLSNGTGPLSRLFLNLSGAERELLLRRFFSFPLAGLPTPVTPPFFSLADFFP